MDKENMIVCVKLLISFKKEDSAIYYNIEKPEIMLREISQTKKNLTLFMYRIKKNQIYKHVIISQICFGIYL